MIEISVIVPVRNGRADLERLLAALGRQTFPRERFELVIADDGSTDGGIDGLDTHGVNVRVEIGTPKNSYAARNRAVHASSGNMLAFCDADCIPEPEWLERGIAALQTCDVAAGRIRFTLSARRTVWALLDMDASKDHEREVTNATAETANLVLRRELYDRVGGFEEEIPEFGDFDFVQRCVAAGAQLAYVPDVVVWHPTRNRARPFLRAQWIYSRGYGEREGREGRLPQALRWRALVPIVQPLRARRGFGRSIGPDRHWLGQNDVVPTLRENVQALPIMYVLLPYLRSAAQLAGWRDGRRRRHEAQRADVLLVCSTGGHLLQLVALRESWDGLSRAWVTFDKSDAGSLLADERVHFAYGPTNRSVKNLARNLVLAWRLLGRARPKVILTTGAGVAVPFAWLGRVRGASVVYVESLTRIDTPSLSCRLIRPVAERVYVQWPELVPAVAGAVYAGNVFGAKT